MLTLAAALVTFYPSLAGCDNAVQAYLQTGQNAIAEECSWNAVKTEYRGAREPSYCEKARSVAIGLPTFPQDMPIQGAIRQYKENLAACRRFAMAEPRTGLSPRLWD